MAVVAKDHGLESNSFLGGRLSTTLSRMKWGVPWWKGNSESGMETNEPVI
jgi:hypothetical protein